MTIKEYKEFLSKFDENLQIDLLGPDCGGYDLEEQNVNSNTICIFEHRNKLFLGEKSIVDKWSNIEILKLV